MQFLICWFVTKLTLNLAPMQGPNSYRNQNWAWLQNELKDDSFFKSMHGYEYGRTLVNALKKKRYSTLFDEFCNHFNAIVMMDDPRINNNAERVIQALQAGVSVFMKFEDDVDDEFMVLCVLELTRFIVPCVNELSKTCSYSTSGRMVECVIDNNSKLDIFSILFEAEVGGETIDKVVLPLLLLPSFMCCTKMSQAPLK